MRANDLVKTNIAYHDTLEPSVWSESGQLSLPVRYRLLEIAKAFLEYLDVPNFKLIDIVLRGSITNYNYTAYSDFDLHLITDFESLDCDSLARKFYDAKKKLWNDAHDIRIKGYDVELYVEDIDDINKSLAAYSVLDNHWITEPVHSEPSIDRAQIERKAQSLIYDIEQAIQDNDPRELQKLKEKIANMRKSGLEAGGEYSTENLVFKILRNQGLIASLMTNLNRAQDSRLSLREKS